MSEAKVNVGFVVLGLLSLALAAFTLVGFVLAIWLPSWQWAATAVLTFFLGALAAWFANEVSE